MKNWYEQKKINNSRNLYERLTKSLLKQQYNILQEGTANTILRSLENAAASSIDAAFITNFRAEMRAAESAGSDTEKALAKGLSALTDAQLTTWAKEYNAAKAAGDTATARRLKNQFSPPRSPTQTPAPTSPTRPPPRSVSDLGEIVSKFYDDNKKALDELRKNSKDDEEWFANFWQFYKGKTGKELDFETLKTFMKSDAKLQKGFTDATLSLLDSIRKNGPKGIWIWYKNLGMGWKLLIGGVGIYNFLFSLLTGDLVPIYTGASPTIFSAFNCRNINFGDPTSSYIEEKFCVTAAKQVVDDAALPEATRKAAGEVLYRYKNSLGTGAFNPESAPEGTWAKYRGRDCFKKDGIWWVVVDNETNKSIEILPDYVKDITQ